MTDQEIITKVDRAIKDLIAVKVALTERNSPKLFEESKQEKKQKFKNDRALDVINYLSDLRIHYKLSSRPLQATKERINLISQRLRKSSVEEAKKVCKTRFIEWGNDEMMKKHLVIETLFRPSKYFKYLEEVDRIEKENTKSWVDTSSSGTYQSWDS